MKEIIFTAAALAAIILLMLILWMVQKKKQEAETKLLKQILSCCAKFESASKSINEIFSILSQYVKAEEYAFYLIDNKDKQYVLKAVHYKNTSDATLNLSYSGLVPHKKVKYAFPVSLGAADFGSGVTVRDGDKMRLISIPIKGGNAVVELKVGPKYTLRAGTKAKLEEIAQELEVAANLIVAVERFSNRIKVLETAKQATRSVASIISGNGVFKMAINMFAKTINAKGGFFLRESIDALELDVESGMTKENSLIFKYDADIHKFFKQIVTAKKIATLNKNDSLFENLPVYFTSEGVRQIILFNMDFEGNSGIAGFWYDQVYEIDDYQTSSLLLMFSKISDVFKRSFLITSHSQDNIETLKLISTLVDDLSPYTVGFSQLMEYYATAIAQELKLPQTEVKKIALAAFLNNIGISVLSYDIFLAKGKYMEYDYEVIKLHSEVGADIIEAIYGDTAIANMVRYHHERIDGLGYPYRIKGDEIPLGAKILAVVQFFVAKISPRSFRDAATFDETLEALRHVAGTQLDADVVDTFLSWITRTRNAFAGADHSLDYCWNMRCVSDEICNKCPAKLKVTKRCWEEDGNACMAHGNKCETCFIFTEYQGRKKLARHSEASLV